MFSQLKEKISRHIKVRLDLVRLEVVERSSGVLSYLMFSLICLFVVFCVLLFIGFGFSEVLTDMGLSRGASFFITTGAYVLLLILIVVLRRQIVGVFSDIFVRIMTEGEDDDENERDNKQK